MTPEEEGFPRPNRLVVTDIVAAAVSWLLAFDPTEADGTLAMDLRDYAAAQEVSFPEAAIALDTQINPRILAVTLLSVLPHWYTGGREQLPHLREYLDFGVLDLDEDTEAADRAMACLIRFFSRLAEIDASPARDIRELRALLADLEMLADAFGALGRFVCAARCFDIGMNLVGRLGAPEYLRCAERARTHVRRLDEPQLAASILMKYAAAQVAAAESDPELALRAYDAVYDAVLALEGQPLLRAQSREFFAKCFSQARYRPLGLFHVISNPDLDRAALPPEIAGMKLVPPVSDAPLDAWTVSLMQIRLLFAEAENGRLLLEPKADDTTVAETDWTSWALSHPTYYRAIPDGKSFLRASTNANLMLVLSHELTHVLSMNGDVGLAILSLKAAATAITLEFYENQLVDQAANLEYLDRLPEFGPPTVVGLGGVERVLNIFRKLQILKAVWSPWFEGVAVLTELADPAKDAEAVGPALEMLQQLVDMSPGGEGKTREAVERAVNEFTADMERRYSAAVTAQAAFRLTEYLISRHDGYLAGYLAARAVTASWREILGEPLSAAISARLLLHLTRGSTRTTTPDFSLPAKEFEEAARELHLGWLRSLTRLSADTLRDAQRPHTSDLPYRSMRWTGGQLEWLDEKETLAEGAKIVDRTLARVAEAWSAPGESATAARAFSGADASAEFAALYARSLATWSPRSDLVKVLMDRMIAPLSVLPFADVEARFWLNSMGHSVFLILRTSEADGDGGGASYNGLLVGLGPDKYAELARQVEERGEFRMKVTRVIDVTAPGAIVDRGMGRHALVMQYGSWIHIHMRGVLLGINDVPASLESDIRSRLEPEAIDRFNRDVLTDGRPFASAVLGWLEQLRPLSISHEQRSAEVSQWGAAIEAAAQDVISESDTETRARVRRALLTRVAGISEERAGKMLAAGLRAFSPFGSPHPVGELVKLLVDSAQQPAPPVALWPEAQELFVESSAGIDVRPAFANT